MDGQKHIFTWRLDALTKSQTNDSILNIDKQQFCLSLPRALTYNPASTAQQFHADNSAVRLIMGAIRSGKSTANCAEIVLRACAMPACKDGIRRAVCVVIRNTYPELETTTVRTWHTWWGNLGEVRTNFSSPISYVHKFNDGNGDIELLVWFLALDKPKDISKLLSLEVTFAYINELRELPFSVFEHLRGRVGQYPPRNMLTENNKNYWYGIFADTNPPDTDHWIYRVFEVDKPEGFKLYRQPPALLHTDKNEWMDNPNAENIQNLPPSFYRGLLPGSTEEYRKVYIAGEYGSVYDGKPVYANYNDDVHAVNKIDVSNGDLYIGWDFGLTPAALLCELRANQLFAIKEWVTERMYFDELLTVVSPYLRMNFKGRTIISVCDPSGSEIYLEMLQKEGIRTEKCDTNEIEPRISAANYFLMRLSAGVASLQISKMGCPTLRKGFLGKYCYKRKQIIGEEQHRDVPDKTHPFSDIHDCFQYICRKITAKLDVKTDSEQFKKVVPMFKNQWL